MATKKKTPPAGEKATKIPATKTPATKTPEELHAIIDEQAAKIADLEKIKEEQDALISEMVTLQKNFEKGQDSGKPTIVIDGETYEIRVPTFNLAGEHFNAAKLRGREDIARHLIKKGSNILKKI